MEKQKQFSDSAEPANIAISANHIELKSLIESKRDRQAAILRSMLQYLKPMPGLDANNNYDPAVDQLALSLVHTAPSTTAPGTTEVLASKDIEINTRICNYMGYIIPAGRSTAHLPCATLVATPPDRYKRTTGAVLLGIPNTIGPTINHSCQPNCALTLNSSKFNVKDKRPRPDWVTIEAIENIKEGESLTINYGEEYWSGHEESCAICFTKDKDSKANQIVKCGGIVEGNACCISMHLQCAQLRKEDIADPDKEYYCPLCIQWIVEGDNCSTTSESDGDQDHQPSAMHAARGQPTRR
jgi:hypothetical protein